MAITNSPRLGIERWSHGTDRHPPRAVWDAQQAILDDLVAIDRQYATLADRPAAGVRGTYCWVEENGVLYRDNGAQWRPIVQFGGGAGAAVVAGGSGAEGSSSRAARADHSHPLPLVTSSAHGAMRKEDKAKLDAATSSPTGNALAVRNAQGRTSFTQVSLDAAPSNSYDAARKDYVDGLVGGVHVPVALPAAANLNAYTSSGVFIQRQTAGAQNGSNYPVAQAGLLFVHSDGSAWTYQEYRTPGIGSPLTADVVFFRSRYNETWSAWRQAAPVDYVDEGDAATASAAEAALAPVRTTVNNATSAATASRLVLRDSAGRARFAAPSNTADAATKGYADAGDAAAQSGAEATAAAALAPVKDAVDNATSIAATTGSRLVRRDASGRYRAVDPADQYDVANRRYVDGAARQDAVLAPKSLGTENLDDFTTAEHTGIYRQGASANATTARNYPEGVAGMLEVSQSTNMVWQRYTTYNNANVYVRGWYQGTWYPWKRLINDTDMATSSADGLMSRSDKALLDAATSSSTGNALARRDASGRVSVGTPTVTSHAARKDYVDAGDASAQSAAEATAAAALSPVKALTDAATANATANALVRRDSAGRFKAATPSATTDVAIKSYVDGKATTAQSNAEATAAAALAPVKTTVDNATANATANRLVLRDSAGRFKAATPSATTDVANKSYVDAVDSKYASTKSTVDAATNLDTPNTLVKRNAAGSVQVNTLLLYGNVAGSNYAVPRSYVDGLVDSLSYRSGARYRTSTGYSKGRMILMRVGQFVTVTFDEWTTSRLDGLAPGWTQAGALFLDIPPGFIPPSTVYVSGGRGEAKWRLTPEGKIERWVGDVSYQDAAGTTTYSVESDPPSSFTWGDPVA